MGTDFKCGCRHSLSWFLCEKHENKLMSELEELSEDKIEKNKLGVYDD